MDICYYYLVARFLRQLLICFLQHLVHILLSSGSQVSEANIDMTFAEFDNVDITLLPYSSQVS